MRLKRQRGVRWPRLRSNTVAPASSRTAGWSSTSKVTTIAYRYQAVYVKFVGTHAVYDAIDAEAVEMEQ